MTKKAGVVFVMSGTALILAALFLILYNRYEDFHAGQEAERMLLEVQSVISEKEEDKAEIPVEKHVDTEMTEVEINGHNYIGYISVPDLKLELPVMSQWNYQKLKIAPCRQFGSSKTDNLVIAAHNFKRHFGKLNKLKIGASVIFTDMDGAVDTYKVVDIETLKPTSVNEVQNSGYDLVLYTCTKGGKTRVTVFCNKIDNDLPNTLNRNKP